MYWIDQTHRALLVDILHNVYLIVKNFIKNYRSGASTLSLHLNVVFQDWVNYLEVPFSGYYAFYFEKDKNKTSTQSPKCKDKISIVKIICEHYEGGSVSNRTCRKWFACSRLKNTRTYGSWVWNRLNPENSWRYSTLYDSVRILEFYF